MPFTLAHPAAALSLRKLLGRLGAADALAIGAMVPDLPYFLPLGVTGAQSHGVGGLFWFCLPAGLVAWAAGRALVRPFVLALAPRCVAARLGPARPAAWSPRKLAGVAVSLLVAALTHIVWDSFTHGTGAAVAALPALRRPVALFPGYTPFVFTILQHGSTVVGLGVLAFWGSRWFLDSEPEVRGTARPLHTSVRVLLVLAWATSSALAGGLVLWARLGNGETLFRVLQNHLGRAIFSAGTVFLTTFMASALAWRAWTARLATPSAAPPREAAQHEAPGPAGPGCPTDWERSAKRDARGGEG